MCSYVDEAGVDVVRALFSRDALQPTSILIICTNITHHGRVSLCACVCVCVVGERTRQHLLVGVSVLVDVDVQQTEGPLLSMVQSALQFLCHNRHINAPLSLTVLAPHHEPSLEPCPSRGRLHLRQSVVLALQVSSRHLCHSTLNGLQ